MSNVHLPISHLPNDLEAELAQDVLLQIYTERSARGLEISPTVVDQLDAIFFTESQVDRAERLEKLVQAQLSGTSPRQSDMTFL